MSSSTRFERMWGGHREYRRWLSERLSGDESFGVAALVLSGLVRVVTDPRVLLKPSTLADALEFTAALRDRA